MIVIRQDQVDSIRLRQEEQLLVEIAEAVSRRVPDRMERLSDSERLELVRSGMDKAHRYRIVDRGDLEDFLVHVANHGTSFDTSHDTPWAGRILGRKGRTASQRVADLNAYTASLLRRPADGKG